jgi:hypothetical protein
MNGVCEMIHAKWPKASPSPPAPILLPSQILGRDTLDPPRLRRASASNSGETFVSQHSNSSSHEAKKNTDDHLDALA